MGPVCECEVRGVGVVCSAECSAVLPAEKS
jgi:hypothetical protein